MNVHDFNQLIALRKQQSIPSSPELMTAIFRPVYFVRSLIITLLLLATPVDAQSSRVEGWWISADDYFLIPISLGLMGPHQTLLIISPDGQVEERMMSFLSPTASDCKLFHLCSDAPIVGIANVTHSQDKLIFSEWSPTSNVIYVDKSDAGLRKLAIGRAGEWNIEEAENGNKMTLTRNGSGRHVMFRVEPTQLQRWRALFMRSVAQMEDYQRWSCFVKRIRMAETETPVIATALLRGASYGSTIATYYDLNGTLDDPVEAKAHRPELLMVEPFSDLAVPSKPEDREALMALRVYIMMRASGLNDAEAREQLQVKQNGKPLNVGLSDGDIATLTNEVEIQKLLCTGDSALKPPTYER